MIRAVKVALSQGVATAIGKMVNGIGKDGNLWFTVRRDTGQVEWSERPPRDNWHAYRR